MLETPNRAGGATVEARDGDAARIATLAADRIAIEGISVAIDGGRFPAKTVRGSPFVVEADVFCDGHDKIAVALLFGPAGGAGWACEPMEAIGNDRWRARVTFEDIGRHAVTILAWRDLFASWRDEVAKKHAAGQPIGLEIVEGVHLVEAALESLKAARGGALAALTHPDSVADAERLTHLVTGLGLHAGEGERFGLLMSEETSALMRRAGVRTNLTRYPKDLEVYVDRPAAAFSAWYELMPRNASNDPARHGTFRDVIDRLPYVRDLGFDVLYFPPIHPIGRTNRKGKNNSLVAEPGDVGSPYAIGAEEGGHDALHPDLGTFEDFEELRQAAAAHGLEIALDFAIQCSPDHPWIREHPEWFDWRPDGSIKFAENPPKKYEDIVNVHFYRDALPSLWIALRDVVLFWVERGVRIFRVDNPHTKPFPFWEWLIRNVQDRHPDVIFLSEAFTRPKVMKRLAKLGFTQSYSYFTWRNRKEELIEYLTELTTTDCRYTMRPNFFVNTPDINPIYLQTSGRAGHQVRLVLAASLAGNYGVYNGFEICEATPVPGKEEYLNSEKYEIKVWDWDRPGHIRDDIRLMNTLRRRHPALQDFTNLAFYNAWNDQILYYGKRTEDLEDFILFAVNLDPHHGHGAHFEVPLWEFGLPDEASIEVEDLVTGDRFTWHGKVQHVYIDPDARPYFIWRLVAPGATR